MPDFSVILQDPKVRAIVQENLLERSFHDALFPGLMFRGEAVPVPWPEHSGDTQIFSAPGLMKPRQKPMVPGEDPLPSTYSYEQWTAQLQQYADTIDTHMPTSMQAIVDLFLRNAHQLGLGAAQTMNRIVRNRMYNASLSGWTVADGAGIATATLRVKRLNGLTRARRPDLAAGSKVRYELVSSTNPLPVTIEGGGAGARNVIAFTPDTPGDEVGPGTVTLDAVATWADRAYVFSVDRSDIVRVGGGNKVDDIGSGDTLKLASIRAALSRFWQNNVPAHSDQRYHAQADPDSISQLYDDDEMQRLNTSLPDYVIYRAFAVGELLGTVFLRNTECPVAQTVEGGPTATFTQDDPFAGELYSNGVAATGVPIHRVLVTAQGGIYEYFSDLSALITEAGVTGKVAEARIVNNGIEVMSDRIQLIIRGPLNRLQDVVSCSWKFIGDWPARTDGATGSAARYKRFISIEHGA